MAILTDPVFGPNHNLSLNPSYCLKANIWQLSRFRLRLFPGTLWVNGAAAYQVIADSSSLATVQVNPQPTAWEQGAIYGSTYPNHYMDIGSTRLYGLFVIVGFSSGLPEPLPSVVHWGQMSFKVKKHTNDELILAFEDGGSSPGGPPDFDDSEVRYRIGH